MSKGSGIVKKSNGSSALNGDSKASALNLLAAQLALCGVNTPLSKPSKKLIVKKKVIKKQEDEGLKAAIVLKNDNIKKKKNLIGQVPNKNLTKKKKENKIEKQASGEIIETKSNTSVRKIKKDDITPTASKTSLKMTVKKDKVKPTPPPAPVGTKKMLRKNGSTVKKSKRTLEKSFKSETLIPKINCVNLSPAISIANLDLPKSMSYEKHQNSELNFWGQSWQEGDQFNPLDDEEFIVNLKCTDKRIWKGAKFKKRVSKSPVLSEIDEEPDDRYELISSRVKSAKGKHIKSANHKFLPSNKKVHKENNMFHK